MIRRLKIFLASSLLFGPVIALPIIGHSQSFQMPEKAFISLSKALNVTDAMSVASEYKLTPVLLEHDFMIDGMPTVGFIPVDPNKTAKDIQKEVPDLFKTFLIDTIESNNRISKEKDIDPSLVKVLAKRNKEMDSMKDSVSQILINRMIFKGSFKDLQSLQNSGDSRVQKVVIQDTAPRFPSIASLLKSSGLIARALAAVNYESWVPEKGYSDVNKSSSSSRYINQDMLWDDVSGFSTTSTYEHDFFVYNYNGGNHYLDMSQTAQDQLPNVQYASSNLPMPYLDTRFSDSKNEVAFTIGSAYAKTIAVQKWYNSYMRFANGKATTDKGKLQGQLGYRSPSTCYTTWCSFGNQNESIIPAWNAPMPGYKSWTK